MMHTISKMMQKQIHLITRLLIVGLCLGTVALTGCSTKLKVIESTQAPEFSSVNLQTARVVINHAALGKAYNYRPYQYSGIYLSNCLLDIAHVYNSDVRLDSKVEDYDATIARMQKNNNMDFLIFAVIENWEDHATEWNSIPDRVTLDLKLVRLSDAKVVAHELFATSSKWATLGGDHPQDLLAQPINTIFNKWFGIEKNLNPTAFPCETATLKSDYY